MMDPVAFSITIGSFVKDIYWYGIIIATGMILAIFVAMFNAKRKGYNSEMILDFVIVAVIVAVIGARIHYVVWSWDFYKGESLWKVFAIWEGGLAIYGGIIGGIIAAYFFSRVRNITFFGLADIAVPSLILGQAIGRWGNFVNQEAYGYQIVQEKFMHFPMAVFIQETGQYHLATFFYESMWNLIGFFILMTFIKKPRKEGKVFFLYLVLYGIGRAIIEGLRTDSQMLLNTGIRINQLISIVIIIIGVAALAFSRRDVSRLRNEERAYEAEETKAREEKREKKIAHRTEKRTGVYQGETVADELKAMSSEMRRQRERNSRDDNRRR